MSLPFTISLDSETQFPMIQLLLNEDEKGKKFSGYIMWLPMTKIQIEYMLCKTDDSRFDAPWYEGCLALNPRSRGDSFTQSWWQSFLTGVRFDEVKTLCGWWHDYDLLTQTEWREVLDCANRIPANPDYIQGICAQAQLHPRARALLIQLETVRQGRRDHESHTLAHQLFLREGIEEYVYDDNDYQQCKIEGIPVRPLQSLAQSTVSNPRIGVPKKSLGFRLQIKQSPLIPTRSAL